MSSIVTYKGKFIWKYSAGNDDSFLGLFNIPEVTGVGKIYNVAFDIESTNQYGEFAWKEVDPKISEVQGEVLVIEPNEIEQLKRYVEMNTPKVSFWKRLTKKDQKPGSMVEMLSIAVVQLSTIETNELVGVWG